IDSAASDATSFTFTAEGASQSHTFTFYDKAGNSSTVTISGINIDETGPDATAVRDTLANAFGWNNTSVQTHYTPTDGLSGTDTAASDPTSFTFTAEGASQSHAFTFYDKAGNSSTVTISGINIDETGPDATAVRDTLANAFGWNNTSVQTHYTPTDGLSGIDTA